jgi:hypothetical protein
LGPPYANGFSTLLAGDELKAEVLVPSAITVSRAADEVLGLYDRRSSAIGTRDNEAVTDRHSSKWEVRLGPLSGVYLTRLAYWNIGLNNELRGGSHDLVSLVMIGEPSG